ncbi:MAG TPA: sugar transferase [Blastocatellia bacterium]|nr:sugar transferase [Blastocatellia bacterium]
MAVADPRRYQEQSRIWAPGEQQAPVTPLDAFESAHEYEFQNLFVSFYARLIRRRLFYEFIKRSIELSTSLILLTLTAPLFVIVAVLIKAGSPGPVFFKHKRLGRGGKELHCLKFRTMVVDAEKRLEADPELRRKFEVNFKIENDPRVTRIGALLRKTCIDELPQLIHVLRGDMSLIGPRPIVEPELNKYGIYGRKLLSIKPGLSGFWQACRQNNTTYDERIRMDMFYIDHRCLSLDLLLLVYTVIAVIRHRGAS